MVTKEQLPSGREVLALPREVKAAIDMTVALAAREFVGNSVSTFSAYIITRRNRRDDNNDDGGGGTTNRRSRKPETKTRAWHYNGGGTPLQEMSLLPRASLRAEVPTFPTPLKLVFCLHVGTSHAKSGETQLHMLKVAVLSALDYTSLVLVCVTTAAPNSEIAKWLVARGVRVVHHTPAWAPAMRRKVAKIKEAKERGSAFFNISHLYGDPDAMIGTFLRIDLPILGFLDEFVLYVDVDVMFRAEVDWGLILDEVQPTERARLVAANHFAAGKFSFSAPGEPGVPRYFSASNEMNRFETKSQGTWLNAGVMLLNMRSLRRTYEGFKDFIFANDDLNWEAGPGDQGAYKSYYRAERLMNKNNGDAVIHSNYLPERMNWKSYWPRSREASIIHFHGPKCEQDFRPYIAKGEARTEPFQELMEIGLREGDALHLCEEFEGYLNETKPRPPRPWRVKAVPLAIPFLAAKADNIAGKKDSPLRRKKGATRELHPETWKNAKKPAATKEIEQSEPPKLITYGVSPSRLIADLHIAEKKEAKGAAPTRKRKRVVIKKKRKKKKKKTAIIPLQGALQGGHHDDVVHVDDADMTDADTAYGADMLESQF